MAKDAGVAVKWFRKAADQNLAEAQVNLGVAYIKGDGVAKDVAEAAKWYRKAAEQNDAEAQYNLGVCYTRGQGVAEDYVEAYKWMSLAAAKRIRDAQEVLRGLERLMTPEQIEKGQKLVRSFKPGNAPSTAGERVNEDLAKAAFYRGEAVKWFRKAAEENNPTAQYKLGL